MGRHRSADFDRLVSRARRGDEAAWAALYDSLAPQVLGYLRLRGAADPEEVLGDAFLHVARGIDGFEGDASKFRSWVFVIATSRLQDERRRLRRKPTTPLEPGAEEWLRSSIDVEDEVERAVAAEEVRCLLSCLSPDQRAVVELRVFGGLTSQEVAETLGKPCSAVKSLYHRGVGALRRHLDAVAEDVPVSPDNVVPLRPRAVSDPVRVAVTRGS